MVIDPFYGLCFEERMNGNPLRFQSRRNSVYVGFDLDRNRFYIGMHRKAKHRMQIGWRKEFGGH